MAREFAAANKAAQASLVEQQKTNVQLAGLNGRLEHGWRRRWRSCPSVSARPFGSAVRGEAAKGHRDKKARGTLSTHGFELGTLDLASGIAHDDGYTLSVLGAGATFGASQAVVREIVSMLADGNLVSYDRAGNRVARVRCADRGR